MEEAEWLREENRKQREEIEVLKKENSQLWELVRELMPLKGRVEELEEWLKASEGKVEELKRQGEEQKEQIEKLEDKQSKDSHNSSLPPSSDRFSRAKRSLREKSGKKVGGQEGHEGRTLCQVSEPDEVVVQVVEKCEHCQANLQTEPVLQVERRQEWDVPPARLVVREYQAEQKCCPRCGQISRGVFPEWMTAPVQYGPAVGAAGVYLVQQQLLSYERACETMEDLLGVSMSAGTLKSLMARCAKNLVEIEERIKEHLRNVEVRHQDETGFYVEGKRWWMHVTSTKMVTHYGVHPKRGSEALDAIGLMEGFTGTSIHDAFGSYTRYPSCKHGGCNVHILRDLNFQEEQKKQAWAEELATVLLEMKLEVAKAKQAGQSRLTDEERSSLLKRYHEAIERGYQANPPDPPSTQRTKGRRKQSKARNLLDRLSKKQDIVLRFLDDFAVPFENNLAERDLRMVKVQQKVSGGFRSSEGATAFARIRGYLSTLRKQSLPILSAIEMALAGSPLFPAL
jgi:transposase